MKSRTNGQPMLRNMGRPPLMATTGQSAELKVRVKNLPPRCSTLDLYKWLTPHGNLVRVEIADRRTEGYALFRPAPTRDSINSCSTSWLCGFDVVNNDVSRRIYFEVVPHDHLWDSPVDMNRKFPEILSVPMARLDVGVMRWEESMLALFTALPTPATPLELTTNMRFKSIEITFGIPGHKLDTSSRQPAVLYKVCFPFAQVKKVTKVFTGVEEMLLVLELEQPPQLFLRTDDPDATHTREALVWYESKAWFRQTGIDTHPCPSSATTQLRKEAAVLDIGRWRTYRLTLSKAACQTASFQTIGSILVDHNIDITNTTPMTFSAASPDDLWQWADDATPALDDDAPSSWLSDMHMPSRLDFKVQYQLEVCISENWIHECNITREFIDALAALEAPRAVNLLEKIARDKKRYFNPMEIFRLQGQVSATSKATPRYCALVPAAVVTPSTIYLTTPVLETSNRIVREHKPHEDRFLRVKFLDEKRNGKFMSRDGATDEEVFDHIYRTMTNGIRIGDRLYEFLAFGNSQVRENGAYFFSATGTISAESIRQSMGDFDHIKVVAKYASRLGQCFSTTRATSIGVIIKKTADIERNGFCFTDGVGKISKFLAQMIADEYNLAHSAIDCPSVFQFRLGGCKGVLAVDPDLKGQVVGIRPSQEKFPAKYYGLEICRISQYSSAYLNVQVILVLNALGVKDWVFLVKLRKAVMDLHEAMTNPFKAIEMLHRNVDYNATSLVIAQMVEDGFMDTKDPFVLSCLNLWRAWMIKYLKEKFRIFVDQGAFLLGCIDETATLQGHFEGVSAAGDQTDPATLPEIFLQIPDRTAKGKYKVVEGICILTRNPALHPGDVRVVRAVDVPQLHHLKNCVVLPQTGDRDLANMCSGGDLDGDDYLVIWDSDLIPPEWNHEPMNYDAPPPTTSVGSVTVDDIAQFFVKYIKSDNLSRIATAHKYWADSRDCPEGVKDDKCLQLAQLHSRAVDFAKTGVAAEMPVNLRIKRWPHWAEVKGKKSGQIYHSRKVLGVLYDEVKRVPFSPAWDSPFDSRILNAYDVSDEMLQSAEVVKEQYDEAMRRVMAQYGIQTEFEAWTTFAMEHNDDHNDYKFAETVGEIVGNVKQSYKELCYEKAGTTAKERDWSKMAPFIAAMYTLTAKQAAQSREPPFISFPWLFPRELGLIARKQSPSFTIATVRPKPEGASNEAVVVPRTTLQNEDGIVLEPLSEVYTTQGVVHEGDLLDVHHKDSAPNETGSGDVVAVKPLEEGQHAGLPSRDQDLMQLVGPGTHGAVGYAHQESARLQSGVQGWHIGDATNQVQIPPQSISGRTTDPSTDTVSSTWRAKAEGDNGTGEVIEDLDETEEPEEVVLTGASSALDALGSMIGFQS